MFSLHSLYFLFSSLFLLSSFSFRLSDLQLSDLKNNNTNSIVFRPSSVDVMRNHESSSDDEDEDGGIEGEIEEEGEVIIQVKDGMDVLSFVVSEKEKKQNHNKRET
tara:strand:+ start:348 stop:665 length:318 start_codon:yes stop_codon:yes gene_type:complete